MLDIFVGMTVISVDTSRSHGCNRHDIFSWLFGNRVRVFWMTFVGVIHGISPRIYYAVYFIGAQMEFVAILQPENYLFGSGWGIGVLLQRERQEKYHLVACVEHCNYPTTLPP